MTTEGFARIEGDRIWYERTGEGFPVVLIHPGLWDARIWDDQFEAFSRHHDVVRYDLRGYGRSDRPAAPYSDLRDLRYLLGELGISRCALVGSASGAQLAVDFALAHPDVTEAIVAVAPGLSGYRWSDAGLDLLVEEVDRRFEPATWSGRWTWSSRSGPRWVTDRRTMDGSRPSPARTPTSCGWTTRCSRRRSSALARLGDIQAAMMVVVGDRDLERDPRDRGRPGGDGSRRPEARHRRRRSARERPSAGHLQSDGPRLPVVPDVTG